MKPKVPIEILANIIPLRPNRFLLEKCTTASLTIPKAGSIITYTSGCPKNQNKCWNSIGSPPPAGSKNEVFRCRSVSNLVTPPANTGRAKSSNTEVTRILQLYLGTLCKALQRLFLIVHIKFIELSNDDTPIKCMLTIR